MIMIIFLKGIRNMGTGSKQSGSKKQTQSQARLEACRELAAKVNYLFETYRPPNPTGPGDNPGEKYTFAEVEKLTNGSVTEQKLQRVAQGLESSPGLEFIGGLGKFFGVPGHFWFWDLDEWQEYYPQRLERASNIENETDESGAQVRVSENHIICIRGLFADETAWQKAASVVDAVVEDLERKQNQRLQSQAAAEAKKLLTPQQKTRLALTRWQTQDKQDK